MYAIKACHNTEMPDYYILGIESPGSLLFAYCARFLSIKYKEIRSDPVAGLCVEDFARQIDSGTKFSAILLSSCNADPTGAVMPESSKKRLVELCQKNQIPIIEYDEFGHFCNSRNQHPPIKVLIMNWLFMFLISAKFSARVCRWIHESGNTQKCCFS